VPEDKLVVLGPITTKRPHLEPMDELVSRIREASRFVPLERLAVSPQCGFSVSVIGNAIRPADQERKIRLVVGTTRRVWGEDTALVSSSCGTRNALSHAATYSPAPDADGQTFKWILEHEYRRYQNPCRTADRID
jgi:hypothetical protein